MVGAISAVSRVPSLILSEDSLVALTARTKVDSLPGFTALLCVVTQCGGGALRDKERLYMKRERREESPFGSAGSISQTAAVNRA